MKIEDVGGKKAAPLFMRSPSSAEAGKSLSCSLLLERKIKTLCSLLRADSNNIGDDPIFRVALLSMEFQCGPIIPPSHFTSLLKHSIKASFSSWYLEESRLFYEN